MMRCALDILNHSKLQAHSVVIFFLFICQKMPNLLRRSFELDYFFSFPIFFLWASKVTSLQLVLSLKPQQSSFPLLQQALQRALAREQSTLLWDEQKGNSLDQLLGPLRQRAGAFTHIIVRLDQPNFGIVDHSF